MRLHTSGSPCRNASKRRRTHEGLSDCASEKSGRLSPAGAAGIAAGSGGRGGGGGGGSTRPSSLRSRDTCWSTASSSGALSSVSRASPPRMAVNKSSRLVESVRTAFGVGAPAGSFDACPTTRDPLVTRSDRMWSRAPCDVATRLDIFDTVPSVAPVSCAVVPPRANQLLLFSNPSDDAAGRGRQH